MRRVILESPFAGELERNKLYLQRCIQDSLARDEAPFASHQMYTDALDDSIEEQRKLGMAAGFIWMAVADAVVYYEDYGISNGMTQSIVRLNRMKKEHYTIEVEFRTIGLNP